MAYQDKPKSTGIIDTRLEPEGPQFPPRPRNFNFKREIEKETLKRLPGLPYVPQPMDEALDESPEAKAFLYGQQKAEIRPPKITLNEQTRRNIGWIRNNLYYDIAQDFDPTGMLLAPEGELEDRIDVMADRVFARQRHQRYNEPLPPTTKQAQWYKDELVSWYQVIFSRPSVRAEVEEWLRERNPGMRTSPSPIERITGEYPWYIMALTKAFKSGKVTHKNLIAYDAMYHDVFGSISAPQWGNISTAIEIVNALNDLDIRINPQLAKKWANDRESRIRINAVLRFLNDWAAKKDAATVSRMYGARDALERGDLAEAYAQELGGTYRTVLRDMSEIGLEAPLEAHKRLKEDPDLRLKIWAITGDEFGMGSPPEVPHDRMLAGMHEAVRQAVRRGDFETAIRIHEEWWKSSGIMDFEGGPDVER